MNAVWTLGSEVDVQRLYERLESWEEGMGDRFIGVCLRGMEYTNTRKFINVAI